MELELHHHRHTLTVVYGSGMGVNSRITRTFESGEAARAYVNRLAKKGTITILGETFKVWRAEIVLEMAYWRVVKSAADQVGVDDVPF